MKELRLHGIVTCEIMTRLWSSMKKTSLNSVIRVRYKAVAKELKIAVTKDVPILNTNFFSITKSLFIDISIQNYPVLLS